MASKVEQVMNFFVTLYPKEYFYHIVFPFSVARRLIVALCDDDIVSAAILCCAVKDGTLTEEQVTKQFGLRIGTLVHECSTLTDETLPWEKRKRCVVKKVRAISLQSCMILVAFETEYLQSVFNELSPDDRKAICKKFPLGRNIQEWFFPELIAVLRERMSENQTFCQKKLLDHLTHEEANLSVMKRMQEWFFSGMSDELKKFVFQKEISDDMFFPEGTKKI